MILEQLLTRYPAEFEEVATYWLTMGASSFGVRVAGRLVAQWPPDTPIDSTDKIVELIQNDAILGELFVTGIEGDSAQLQLKKDGQFISRLAIMEDELDLLTLELVNSQDQLVALYDLVHSTRHLVSVDEIIRGLTDAISRIFMVETTFIALERPQRPLHIAQSGKTQPPNAIQAVIAQTLAQPEYLLVDDQTEQNAIQLENVDSLLAMSLIHSDLETAVLGLINNFEGPFESPAIKLLRATTDYAASRIENAILHEASLEYTKEQTRLQTEMKLAHDVQMNLMPQHKPEFAGLDIAAASRPALSVGGDFYDYIVQQNGLLYFTLGDVSGKGMSAALLMAMTRTIMRNTARLLNQASTEVILDRTTEALYDDFTDVGMFATVFTGMYDAQSKKISYANAGHAPVIHRPANGHAYLMEATGPPLCITPENLAHEKTFEFCTDDLLVIATDGLNEARNNNGELFDYERILTLVDNLAAQPAQDILDGLLNAVAQFSHGQLQDDDQTIIVIKRNNDE